MRFSPSRRRVVQAGLGLVAAATFARGASAQDIPAKPEAGAIRMGIEHGLYCVGCCWLLMSLLFVVGVMHLVWVAVIAVFVLIEKLVPQGETTAKINGVALLALALFLALNA